MKNVIKFQPRLVCSHCGSEIGFGDSYWYINGWTVCAKCLEDFARMEYAPFRRVRGKEAVR